MSFRKGECPLTSQRCLLKQQEVKSHEITALNSQPITQQTQHAKHEHFRELHFVNLRPPLSLRSSSPKICVSTGAAECH